MVQIRYSLTCSSFFSNQTSTSLLQPDFAALRVLVAGIVVVFPCNYLILDVFATCSFTCLLPLL
ncbi:hypothetical protein Syun_025780 [Stephania yunnanensis]|uniref:Uncharacterized protein n=1 Tax=Stephania yunnanensis TaxID=152371 RepID=A0AAP0EUX8_9MAGN